MENALTSSMEQLVIDNEIFGMIFRAVRGIKVDDDTLAFDLIKDIFPDGNFLSEVHTLDHMREEMYISSLSFKSVNSQISDKYDIVEAATETAENIINTHTPPILPADKVKNVYTIMEKALKY